MLWIIFWCVTVMFCFYNLWICAWFLHSTQEHVVSTSHTRWKQQTHSAVCPWTAETANCNSLLPVTLTRTLSQNWATNCRCEKLAWNEGRTRKTIKNRCQCSMTRLLWLMEVRFNLCSFLMLSGCVHWCTVTVFTSSTASFIFFLTVMSQQGLCGAELLMVWPVVFIYVCCDVLLKSCKLNLRIDRINDLWYLLH